MPKIQLPAWAATALALVAGVLTVLNQTTFGFDPTVKSAMTVGLAILATLGIGPLLGQKFRAALHLSAAVVSVVGAVEAVLLVFVQQNVVSLDVRAAIIGVLTVLGGLGFGMVGSRSA